MIDVLGRTGFGQFCASAKLGVCPPGSVIVTGSAKADPTSASIAALAAAVEPPAEAGRQPSSTGGHDAEKKRPGEEKSASEQPKQQGKQRSEPETDKPPAQHKAPVAEPQPEKSAEPRKAESGPGKLEGSGQKPDAATQAGTAKPTSRPDAPEAPRPTVEVSRDAKGIYTLKPSSPKADEGSGSEKRSQGDS